MRTSEPVLGCMGRSRRRRGDSASSLLAAGSLTSRRSRSKRDEPFQAPLRVLQAVRSIARDPNPLGAVAVRPQTLEAPASSRDEGGRLVSPSGARGRVAIGAALAL